MKQIYLSVAILILLPACILLGQFYLKSSTGTMRQTLSTAESDVRRGDKEAAKAKVKQFTAEWRKSRPLLATFIRHAELDPVTQGTPRLAVYLDGGEKTEFLAQSSELRTQLRHLYDMERFSLYNFF